MSRIWRPGIGQWVFAAVLGMSATGLVRHDFARPPAWWELALHVTGCAGFVVIGGRGLVWRVAASAEGLRIRTGRSVRTMRWDEMAGARSSWGGELVLVGMRPATSVVLGHTGFWRPRRIAAEIAAMVADPALRPTAG